MWLNEFRSLGLTAHTSQSPLRRGFVPSFVNYKKVQKVYQLLGQGRWFSPSTPASSTTKTGRHDIAEIVLKVALNTKIQIQILRFAASEYCLVSSTFCFLTRTTRNILELSVARLKYSWLLSSITY